MSPEPRSLSSLSDAERAALLKMADAIEDRASYDSGYRNPSEGDKAWKRGMHHAAKMLRDAAYGTHSAQGAMQEGLVR